MAIKILRSDTADKRPDPSAMAAGQLAINYESGSPGLYFKDNNGALIKVGPVHIGPTAPNATPPEGGTSGNSKSELWLDNSVTPNQLKCWNGTAWVSTLPDELPVAKLANGTARQLLQTDADGTGVEWASNIDVPGTLDVTGAATFDGNVTVQGDLTVNGTETIINTQTLEVEDKNVVLGNVETPSDTTADGGGLTLKGATDKTLNWVDATDSWTSSEHVDLASGKSYRINGTEVLSATALGSSVQISSSNIPSGTVTNDDLAGSIANDKLSNSSITVNSSSTALGGSVTLYAGTTTLQTSSANQGLTGISSIALPGATSGTITVTPAATAGTTAITVPATSGTLVTTGDTGTVTNTMLAGSIANNKLSNSSITVNSASTALGGSVTLYAGTTTLQTSSANQGLTGISSIALPGATSGTITVAPAATAGTTAITLPATSGTLITTGDSGTVTSAMLANGTIVNEDISASAAIADTKLDTISTAGKVSNSATTATSVNTPSTIVSRDANGDFSAGTITANLSGNASTVTTNANLTGDVTSVGNATAIAAGVIVNADVNGSAAIAGTKISPDFGAQNVTTTGTSTAASFNPTSSTVPTNGVYLPAANSVGLATNGAQRLLIDSAGQIEAAGLGTAAAPSWSYVGDPNTGTFSPGADTWAISTGGSERLRVSSTGLVGIGTSSPTSLLFLSHAASTAYSQNTEGLTLRGSSGIVNRFTSLNFDGSVYSGNVANIAGVTTTLGTSYANSAGALRFATKNTTDATPVDRLTITAAGNVGIGTTSPGAALEINAAASTSPAIFKINTSEVGRWDSSGRLLVGTSSGRSGRKLQVEGDGLGVYGALTFQKYVASVPVSTSTEIVRASGFADNTNQASAYRVTVMATFAGATTRVKEYIWIPQIFQTTGARVLSSALADVVNNANAGIRATDFTVAGSKTGDDEILSITVTTTGTSAPSVVEVMVLVQGIGGRSSGAYPYVSPVS